MSLPLITEAGNLEGKRVILRAGIDVPIENDIVQNVFRVRRSIPTLKFLVDAGAKVTLITHIGRDPEITVAPVFEVLKKGLPITYVPKLEGEEVDRALAAQENGSIVFLENVRSDPREKENDEGFAKLLAGYGEIYVNDAFSVAHREHASIVGIPAHLPSYAGISFQKEYEEIKKTMEPEHPSIFILGGAKFETKQPLVESYVEKYEYVFIGGALANDFFKGLGYEVGQSLVSETSLAGNPLLRNQRIILPIDVLAFDGSKTHVKKPGDVEPHEKIVDIGPDTIELLNKRINETKTVLWNGPVGYYEDGYAEGTESVARIIATANAYSLVGGGDTVAAIEQLGIHDRFGFLSSAGGAMLTFLEHGSLPGIEALSVNS